MMAGNRNLHYEIRKLHIIFHKQGVKNFSSTILKTAK